MNSLRQTGAVVSMNLRSVPSRYGTSLVVIVGIATVVAVMIAVMAMAKGFLDSAKRSGRPDRAIVLGRGAETETASGFSRESATAILNAPGVRRTPSGEPIGSAEHLAFVIVSDRLTGRDTFVTIRGVGPQAFALRPEMKLVAGRMFKAGLHELVAGRMASQRAAVAAIGDKITLPQGDWKVVGIFESNGDSHESELLADANTLLAAMQRGDWFSSTTVWLDNEDSLEDFKRALTTNPSLSVDVKREPVYFEEAAKPMGQLMMIVAYVIGGFMALGALFGALNTMYSAISARSIEIATLRAIGFGAGPVVMSVLVEALLLALLGATIGSAIAWFLFNGNAISTATSSSPSQITFSLKVTVGLVATGMGCALLIGLLGGLFPAIRAARRSVVNGLRA